MFESKNSKEFKEKIIGEEEKCSVLIASSEGHIATNCTKSKKDSRKCYNCGTNWGGTQRR